ncbi:MAG: hypothetical protein ABIU87_00515 [Ornithinibacter sp.]
MPSALEQQRAAAALILDVTSDVGFALAGSGAIREHGLLRRPTRGVALFTNDTGTEAFAAAVERAVVTLTHHDHQVIIGWSADRFARLAVIASDGYQFEVDLGVDWRAHEPVRLHVGPVLDVQDAVANKLGALYSRAAPRDYLDVDAIRQSERFSDAELLRLAVGHDPGFDPVLFAEQLSRATTVPASALTEYGVSSEHVLALHHRLTRWAAELVDQRDKEPNGSEHGRESFDAPKTDPRRNPPRHPDRPPPRFSI